MIRTLVASHPGPFVALCLLPAAFVLYALARGRLDPRRALRVGVWVLFLLAAYHVVAFVMMLH